MNPDDLVKNKIKEVKEFLKFDLGEDDKSIAEMLTLGGDWDRPEVVMEALDRHAEYEAKWACLLRQLNLDRDEAEAKMKAFEADSKETITDLIFNQNVSAGMTANNANPTLPKINGFYLIRIVEGDTDCIDYFTSEIDDNQIPKDCETLGDRVLLYKELKLELDVISDDAAKVELVVKAFKNRSVMLVQMGGLLKSMMDNQIVVLKRAKTKTSQVPDEDGFIT